MTSAIRNVEPLHGGFVDGSDRPAVHRLLTADGFTVKIAQNPTPSVAAIQYIARHVNQTSENFVRLFLAALNS
ncbi:hypothetical protein ACFFX1_06515 [Dactylosporangium sucinum]|nr:hypothetical protein [Dactylosporangium sucinum]